MELVLSGILTSGISEFGICSLAVLICLIGFGVNGYNQGLVKSAGLLISFIISIVIIGVIAGGIESYNTKKWVGVGAAIVLLAVINLIHKCIEIIVTSLKIVTKLPIVSWLDKLAGFVFGLLVGLGTVWIVFILCGYLDLFGLSQWIIAQVSNSPFLTYLYNHNKIIEFMQTI